MRYFEIEFAHKDESIKQDSCSIHEIYSICILGERKPTCKEAEEFCRKDMEGLGYDMVSDVLELTEDEAYDFFDMSNVDNFPVFKQNST